MCWHIYICVPTSAKVATIRRIADAHARDFWLDKFSLEGDVVPRDRSFYCTTRGHCDCGTPIGTRARGHNFRPSDRELEKLYKKGWSDAKVARWTAQRRSAAEHREAQEPATTPDVQTWLSLLRKVLTSGASGRIGLIKLWSPKRNLQLRRHEEIPISQATEDLLYCAKDRVLYDFLRSQVA